MPRIPPHVAAFSGTNSLRRRLKKGRCEIHYENTLISVTVFAGNQHNVPRCVRKTMEFRDSGLTRIVGKSILAAGAVRFYGFRAGSRAGDSILLRVRAARGKEQRSLADARDSETLL